MRIDPAKPRPLEKNMPLNVTDGSLVPIQFPLSPPLRISAQPVAVGGQSTFGGKKDDTT